ncbi:MAG: capsule assembly Wzi family protein [Armatimonadota bacterium]
MRKLSNLCLMSGCLLAVISLISPALCAEGQRVPQISYDTVPRASLTIDALGWLAKDGKLLPYTARDFLIDRLWTRIEIADLLRDRRVTNGNNWDGFTDKQRQVVLQLASEFRDELRYLDVDYADFTAGLEDATAKSTLVTPWLYGDVRDSDNTDTTSRGIASFTALELVGSQTSVGATISGERRLFQAGGSHSFPVLDRLSFRGRGKNWDWEVGKFYDWYGEARTGSMWFGDSSPALISAKAARDLRLPLIGDWHMSFQVGGFHEGGETLYLISKRYEKTLSRKWSFAITDMAKTTTTPNPLMLVIPAQLYQSLFLTQIDTKWNTVMGLEAGYHIQSKLGAYAQYLIDDMEDPFDPNPMTPKKTGILVGLRSRSGQPMDAGFRWSAEYSVIDQRTYEATRPSAPLLSWTQDGLPLGWPFGANSKTLALHGEHKFGNGFDLAASYVDSRPKEGDGKQQVLSISPTKDFGADKSIGLLYEHHAGVVGDVFGVRGFVAF